MSTIYDLYYDNLCLADRIFNKKSEHYKIQMELSDMVERFAGKLNNTEDRKEFRKIDELHTRITSELEYDAFTIGLKFGIRLMHEVFQDDVPESITFPLR